MSAASGAQWRSAGRALGLIVVGVISAGMASCAVPAAAPSKAGSETATPAASPHAALPPVFIEPADAAGRTYRVPLERRAVFTSGKVPPETWRCEVVTPGVVRFEPGRQTATATYNPGFTPVAVGRTAVTMTAGAASYTFTIEVTET